MSFTNVRRWMGMALLVGAFVLAVGQANVVSAHPIAPQEPVIPTHPIMPVRPVLPIGPVHPGDTTSAVEVYNGIGSGTAIDVVLRLILPRVGPAQQEFALASLLKPGYNTGFEAVPAGHGRLDVRLNGRSTQPLLREQINLEPGRAYCAIVGTSTFGSGHPETWVRVMDVTRQVRTNANAQQVCEKEALALGVSLP